METAYLEMIRGLLNSKLTAGQERRLRRLMAKEKGVSQQHTNQSVKAMIHNPRATAAFLALFNKEQGFKYLTHDFIPGSDWDYAKIVSTAKNAISEFDTKQIPNSLSMVVRAFVHGKKGWYDSDNKHVDKGYSSEEWKKWSDKTHKHPIQNAEFNETIQQFRHTTRIVAPELDAIIKEISERYEGLSVTTENLKSMDFYTYTKIFKEIINKILGDMAKRTDFKSVSIVGKNKYEREYVKCIITITQQHSFSDNKLEDAMNRLKNNQDSGDFGSLKNLMTGYCDWTVESKWDGVPMRWNILKEDGVPDSENIDNAEGFSHILTFHKKI